MTKSLVDSDYLKQAAELFQPIKRRSFELMNIEPGHTVLDVGCGTGDDLVALQDYKPGVDAIGVDADPEMVVEANDKLAGIGISHAVVGDVENLDFYNDTFNSVRAERVFMHLEDPAAALDEMVGITKPGGRVVVVETDWTSLTVGAGYRAVESILNLFRMTVLLKSGHIGRQLFGMFKRHGLTDVNIEIHPIHTHSLDVYDAMSLSPQAEAAEDLQGQKLIEEIRQFRSSLTELDQAGEFFASVNILTVSGTKKEESNA